MIIRDFRHLLPDGPGTGSGNGSGDGAGTGGGAGSGSSGSGEGGQGGSTGSGGQEGGQGGASGPGSGSGEPQDVASLPQWAQDLIGRTRTEAAGHRTERNTERQRADDVTEAVKRALGLSEAPNAEQLGEQLRAAQTETRQARVETAVARGASTHGADAGRLLNRVDFLGTVRELDPTASDFSTKVGDAIKAAVAADDTLRVQPAGQGGQQDGAGARRLHDPSQGSSGRGRDASASTVQAGRDLYRSRRGKAAADSS